MKVVTPQVFLVSTPRIRLENLELFGTSEGKQVRDWVDQQFRPVQDVCDSEAIPEIAGRLCYMSFANPRPGGNKAYLDHILAVGHGSVLEHSNFGFIITGVSRSFTHELVRHRAGFAFSQLSQRYVDESEANYVMPSVFLKPELSVLKHMWEDVVSAAQDFYKRIVGHLNEHHKDIPDATARKKASRQAARSVLPNATETKIFVTANVRAWRHFIEMRCSAQAEPEIRQVAGMILKVLQQEAPNLFGDYSWSVLDDGSEVVSTLNRKV